MMQNHGITMTEMTTASLSSLKNRRQSLRTQRRLKAWQSLWRFLALCGLTGSLCWGISLPYWLIRESSQVKIEGNHWLSTEQLYQLLSFSYPQSIWQLPSQRLKQQLETHPPIADVQVNRSLIPPEVNIIVQERQPIAIATSAQGVGFIDREGVFIPQSFYQGKSPQLSLKVIGYENDYHPYWQGLYTAITQSPVAIREVDWRNPSNIILKTDLGMVYCGAYSSQFSQQLQVLSQMGQLSSRIALNRIQYLDLTNPSVPTVQLKHEPKKQPIAQIVRER